MKYGKFETAEGLLKGYNELEKAFTQKCQELKQVRKDTAREIFMDLYLQRDGYGDPLYGRIIKVNASRYGVEVDDE